MSDDNVFISSIYGRHLISSMLAILGSVLGQIVSAVIIGHALGPGELSVIGITLPVYYVFATAGALLGVGGTAVCARLIGQSRFEESRHAFIATYLMTLATAAVLSAGIFVFANQTTVLLGLSSDMDVFPKVREYVRVLSAGGLFIMSIYPAFNLLRLDGRYKATASIFFVMSGANIIVSCFLVVSLGIGITGAAVGTVCGAGASGILGAALLFTRNRSFRHVPQGMGKKKLNSVKFSRMALDIIVSGSPSALENLCILARTLIINWILVSMLRNMTALSAYKVTDSINSFAQIIIAGVAGAMMPFVGVLSTERDTSSIRQLLSLGFKWGGFLILAFTASCLIFAKRAAGLFGMGDGVNLNIAIPAIRLFVLSLPLAAVNNILVCLYQAGSLTAMANALTFSRSLLWVVPAALMLSKRIGVAGVWHCFWIAELIALAFAVILSAYSRHKNKYRSRLFLLDTEAEVKGIYKSFSVNNSIESITESAASINDFCDANGLSPGQTMAISLSIEEMLVMICRHSFAKSSNDTMNVRILIYDGMIVLRIRNGGKAFNPVEYYERQSAADKDYEPDIFSDSLGIGMVLKLAETVDYRNTFGVNNVTIVI
ncbi:MAG: MATE family efflux transporter [Oscillospiraceae bacterium]|nr:MATE family efflux transporter [Oscillospiraceae bacterium]